MLYRDADCTNEKSIYKEGAQDISRSTGMLQGEMSIQVGRCPRNL